MAKHSSAIPRDVIVAITNAANLAARALEKQRPHPSEDLRDLFGAIGVLEWFAIDIAKRTRAKGNGSPRRG